MINGGITESCTLEKIESLEWYLANKYQNPKGHYATDAFPWRLNHRLSVTPIDSNRQNAPVTSQAWDYTLHPVSA